MVKPGKIQLAEKDSWEDGYKSLFYFPNFKEFISRINDEAE